MEHDADPVATGLGGVVTVVGTVVCKVDVKAASAECGVSGGIRANAGRALLKISSVVVGIWYGVSVNLPDGAFILVVVADSGVSAV